MIPITAALAWSTCKYINLSSAVNRKFSRSSRSSGQTTLSVKKRKITQLAAFMRVQTEVRSSTRHSSVKFRHRFQPGYLRQTISSQLPRNSRPTIIPRQREKWTNQALKLPSSRRYHRNTRVKRRTFKKLPTSQESSTSILNSKPNTFHPSPSWSLLLQQSRRKRRKVKQSEIGLWVSKSPKEANLRQLRRANLVKMHHRRRKLTGSWNRNDFLIKALFRRGVQIKGSSSRELKYSTLRS